MGNPASTAAGWNPESETPSEARKRLWREGRYEAFKRRFTTLAGTENPSLRTEQGRKAFYRALAEFPPPGIGKPTADDAVQSVRELLEVVRELINEVLPLDPTSKPAAEVLDDLVDLLIALEDLVKDAMGPGPGGRQSNQSVSRSLSTCPVPLESSGSPACIGTCDNLLRRTKLDISVQQNGSPSSYERTE